MALGFGGSKKDKAVVADAPPLTNAPEDIEKPAGLANGYGGQDADFDPENGSPYGSQRRMSRIDKAVTKPIGATDLPDDSSGMSVGKQMELESANAIKYRTCTWQKV